MIIEKLLYELLYMLYNMKEMLVARNVNKEVYRKFKQKASERGLKIGNAISDAMELWIRSGKKDGENFKKIMSLSGVIKMKGKGNWSERVDEILYGYENDIPRH